MSPLSTSLLCLIFLLFVVFPADPLSPPFLLTLLIYHSSSVFTFYLFCRYLPLISPLPFHIFLCAIFFSSYYSLSFSLSFLISPLCTFVSFRLSLCFVDCFCSFIFLSMFSFTLFSHCCRLSIFAPSSLLPDFYLLFFGSSPLSRVADLFLQVYFHFLLSPPPSFI